MNLDLLDGKWEVQENPGLETTDPRLDEISTLVQEAEFWDAAQAAQTVLEESIYDVRVIGFFLYGVFLEQGMTGLTHMFRGLAHIVGENWEALGPVAKKEKHTQTSLRWMANQLLKKLQHEEEKRTDLWHSWQSQVSSDDVAESLDALDALRRQLAQVLGESAAPVLDSLVKIAGWLAAFQQLVYREAAEEPETSSASEEEAEPDSELFADDELVDRRPSRISTGSAQPLAASSEDAVFVEGSHHLREFMHKLSVFDRLITDGKFNLAALVADDVMETITQFDPRVYFPKLFARFFQLMAAHIGEISSYGYDKESMEWQVLRELYKVDPDGFAEL